MRTFRFKLSAHNILEVKGNDVNEAKNIAILVWCNTFKNMLYGFHGHVEFIEEIKEKSDK